ncbi:MAG: hypothetical protein OXI18_03910 [bacterium]|nr:hypothetical protein [bacterium]
MNKIVEKTGYRLTAGLLAVLAVVAMWVFAGRAYYENNDNIRYEVPVAAHHEGPEQTHHEQPVQTHHEGPEQTHHEQPVQTHHEGPEQTHHECTSSSVMAAKKWLSSGATRRLT